MKWKRKLILTVLIVLLVPIVYAGGYTEYVTIGQGDSRWCQLTGCNYTGDIYAIDYLLWNGSSCCQGGAAGVTTVTATSPIVSSEGATPDISWNPVNIGLGWDNLSNVPADIADGDDDTTIGNCSVIDSCSNILYLNDADKNCSVQDSCSLVAYQTDIINNCSVDNSCGLIVYGSNTTNWDKDTSDDVSQSWVTNRFVNVSWVNVTYYNNALNSTINSSIDLRVTLSFLQNLLDTVYASITNVQSWIDTNKTESESALRDNIDKNVTEMNSRIVNTSTSKGSANISCTGNLCYVNMSIPSKIGNTTQEIWNVVDNGSFVPYVGATKNVDLGSYNLTVGTINISIEEHPTYGQLIIQDKETGTSAEAWMSFLAEDSIIGWVGDKSNTGIDFYVSATQNDLCLGDDSDTCVIRLDAGKVSFGDTTPETGFDVDNGNVSFDNGQFFFDKDNNRVGIGTTAPKHKLEVAGSINLSGDLNATGTICDGYGNCLDNVTGTGNSSQEIWNVIDNGTFVPYVGADKNVNLGANNFTIDTNTLFVDSTGNRVLIGLTGGYDPRTGLSVSGDFDVSHTATENDDHAVEIDVDAGGFGDVKGIDIVYTTGAISTGEEEEVILINIDESKATGGDVIGVDILATEGSAGIYGLEAGALVNPVVQLSGTFANMDSANNSGKDDLSNFTTSDNDSNIFVNDNDYITIGDADKFEELEFLLNTSSSNPGIKPTFEYSTGVGTWGTFSPADGTNGMRNTGIIAWFDSDIPTWDTGAGSEYLIRITRTQNNLVTTPIEDKVQIAAVTVYKWDKNGDLVIRDMNATNLRGSWNGSVNYYTTTQIDSSFNGLLNISMQLINDSFKNFSQWLGIYPNVDTDSTNDISITVLQNTNDSLKKELRDNIDKNATSLRDNIDKNITKLNSEKVNITTQFGGDVSGTYGAIAITKNYNTSDEIKNATLGYNNTLRINDLNTTLQTETTNRISNDTSIMGSITDNVTEVNSRIVNTTTSKGSQNISCTGNLCYINMSITDTDTTYNSDEIYIYESSNVFYQNVTKLNMTINSSIDLRVNLAFLQNLLDTVYASIANVQSWISGNKTNTESILRGNINDNVTLLNARDNAINTSGNIYLLAPPTNRTDIDINTTVSEPTIVRTGWDNVTYMDKPNSGNLNLSDGNITTQEGNYWCLNAQCTKFICSNASVIVINSNVTNNGVRC